MMDFSGPDLEISFICCIIDILIAIMGGLEVTLIGYLVHLLQIRKKYQTFGEEVTSSTRLSLQKLCLIEYKLSAYFKRKYMHYRTRSILRNMNIKICKK